MAFKKQIPWHHTLYFFLDDIHIATTFSKNDDDPLGRDTNSIVEKVVIRSKLIPGYPDDPYDRTKYYMFGSDGVVEEINLTIYKNKADAEEGCCVRGGVALDTEIDFREEKLPDYIDFIMHMNAGPFNSLVEKISRRVVASGVLRVGGVQGFYSSWSPSISTSDIKVLTSNKRHHPVEIPEGCEIEPPRLGTLADYALNLWSERTPPNVEGAGVAEGDEEASVSSNRRSEATGAASVNPQVLSLLKSLLVAAWIIAMLLLIVALK